MVDSWNNKANRCVTKNKKKKLNIDYKNVHYTQQQKF